MYGEDENILGNLFTCCMCGQLQKKRCVKTVNTVECSVCGRVNVAVDYSERVGRRR